MDWFHGILLVVAIANLGLAMYWRREYLILEKKWKRKLGIT